MNRPETLADLNFHRLERQLDRGQFLHGKLTHEEQDTARVLVRAAKAFGARRARIEQEGRAAHSAGDLPVYDLTSSLLQDIRGYGL